MRKTLLLTSSGAALVAALFPSTARAQEAAPPPGESAIDRPGRVFVDDIFGMRTMMPTLFAAPSFVSGLFGYRTSTSTMQFLGAPSAPLESTTMWVAPTVDVLATRNLTLGGTIDVQRTTTSVMANVPEQRSWGYGVRPRVGYIAPLSRDVAVWPRVTLGYAYSEAQAALGPQSPSTHTWLASADVAFMFRLGRYAYFNLGPALTYVRTRSGESSTVLSEGLAAGGRMTFGLTF